MADKRLTLVIQAKNMVAQGLSAAGSAISSFAKSVGSALASVAKWVGIISSALGGISFVRAIRDAHAFEKQVGQIATLTDSSFGQIKKQVRELSSEFGLAKEEIAKGFYDALSSGVPEDNVFEFMRSASRSAIAGASTASEAVGLLIGAMNQFQIPTTKAEAVSDLFFNTVRYGITTIPELAQHLSAVGPIAAASGVSLEELSAALMTLTIKKVPTAEAVTQIRAAIVSMNETLGDGWAAIMTLQDGMLEMERRAKGSRNALKDMTGRVEGMNAILSMTGKNAEIASRHLDIARKSSGATAAAFAKMAETTKLDRLWQSLHNILITVGDAALTVFATTIEKGAIAAARLGEAIAKWVEGDKIKKLREDIDGIVTALGQGGEARSDVVQALGGVIIAAFKDGASLVGDAIRDAFADTAVGKVKTALDGASTRLGVLIGGGTKAEADAQVRKERSEEINGAIARNLPVALEKLRAVAVRSNAGGYGNATDQFERAQAAARKDAEETKRQRSGGGGIGIAAESKKQEINIATVSIEEAAKARLKEIEELTQKRKEADKQVEADKLARIEEARDAEIQALKDVLDEKKRIAGISIADFVASKKADKDARKQAEDEDKKAARLLGLERRKANQMGGGELNKNDAEWLAGWKQQRGARAGIGAAALNLANAEKDKLQAAQNARDRIAKEHLEETIKTRATLERVVLMG
jgi:TP901 family phage tail tape measure protein